MGRICAIKNCPTRTSKNSMERKARGLRPLAIFSIPKRNNALQIWSEAVRQKLWTSDCICELHFASDSVVKEDRTVLANGDVHVLPRQKAKLVLGAIPLRITDKENVQPVAQDRTCLTVNALQCVDADTNRQNPAPGALPVEGDSEAGLEADTISNEAETKCESADERMDPIEFLDDSSQSSSESSTDIQIRMGRHCAFPKCPSGSHVDTKRRKSLGARQTSLFTIPKPRRMKVENVTLDHESARDIYENRHEESIRNDFAICGDFDYQCRSSSAVDVKNEEVTEYVIVKPCDNGRKMPFTIDNILGHLSAGWMPERWSWMRNPKEESSIVFIQIDAYTLGPRQQLILRNDLSITACTGDGKVSYKLEQLAKSIETIKTILYEHGKTIICGGTGHQDKTRSEECCGFMSANEYRKFVQTPRCIDCRQLRQKLQNRYNRSKADVNPRYARSKHAVRMEPRLNATAKQLRQKIKRAERECAAIKKQALMMQFQNCHPFSEKLSAIASISEN